MYDTEDEFHTDCYLWFHNEFPGLRGLLCYNLNNSKNKIAGTRNRSKGLQAGRSDLVFYYHGRALHIELKLPGRRQSPDQRKWQRIIEAQGFRYVICRTMQEFKDVILAQIKK